VLVETLESAPMGCPPHEIKQGRQEYEWMRSSKVTIMKRMFIVPTGDAPTAIGGFG
jgi:hypothetical protein